ncbi:MAG: hypothetical protein IRY89_13930 [Pseudolabrys sp.]|nr:hypothetical protein [Pseudolabrys sp.]
MVRPRSLARQRLVLAATAAALLYADVRCGAARAQVFDFGAIEAFESLGSGTQRGGDPPKTIVDDGERHTVLFTILESNTEARIYWRSPEGPQTTIMRGEGLRAFQTMGEFRIEAAGDDRHSFRYGYLLFRLKNGKSGGKDKI